MRGLWIDETGTARLRDDLEPPRPREGWTRVDVARTGVCATDLALCRGYMGFVGTPGHEFVGRAIDGPLAGRRVVGEINAACGSCRACRAGNDRHCPHRSVLGILGHGGAFAEQLSLPDGNLLAVPDAVSDDAATFTEPLAAALRIAEQLGPRTAPGTDALIAGDGRLGILCAHAVASMGCRVTVAGRHPARASLLPDGASHRTGMLEAASDDAEPRYTLAVEATGRPETLGRLLPWVTPMGTVVLKTTTEKPVPLDTGLAVVHEITLLGSRCGRFAPALELLANQAIPVEEMIEARLPLSAADQALERAAQPGTLKVLVTK